MRAISIIITGTLLAACGSGCAVFKARPASIDSDALIAPGEVSAPMLTIAGLDEPLRELNESETASTVAPLVFGAGDTLGRALYARYIAYVRAQKTPRHQLAVYSASSEPY